MWRYLLAAVFLIVVTAQPGLAGEGQRRHKWGYSATYDACMNSGDAAQGTTFGMNNCTNAEAERQDRRLNEVYRDVMARLDSRQRIILRRSERRWLAGRRASCAKLAAPTGTGSLSLMMENFCNLTDITERRKWLERYHPR